MEFSDLQRRWADRFTQDKRSENSEKDLQALLATHRARVVQLREELLQEEFLVEFFERALSDERQRRRQSVTSHCDAALSSSSVAGCLSRSSSLVLSRENSLSGDVRRPTAVSLAASSANFPADDKDGSDASRTCATSGHSVQSTASSSSTTVSPSGVLSEISTSSSGNIGESVGAKSSTDSDSSYVTVIAVSPQQQPDEDNGRAARRKPPALPPKRVARWPPVQPVTPIVSSTSVSGGSTLEEGLPQSNSTVEAAVAPSQHASIGGGYVLTTSASLTTFGKPNKPIGCGLAPYTNPSPTSASATSSFQLALSSFRQAASAESGSSALGGSSPSTPMTPGGAIGVTSGPGPGVFSLNRTSLGERSSPVVSASASDLSSSLSKSNDSSLERNTNTAKSTDSSLERNRATPTTAAAPFIIERSASCRLERRASNARTTTPQAFFVPGNRNNDCSESSAMIQQQLAQLGRSAAGGKHHTTLHLLKDGCADPAVGPEGGILYTQPCAVTPVVSNNNTMELDANCFTPEQQQQQQSAGSGCGGRDHNHHRRLDKTSTISSNDSSLYDALSHQGDDDDDDVAADEEDEENDDDDDDDEGEAPIYDTVAADETDAEESIEDGGTGLDNIASLVGSSASELQRVSVTRMAPLGGAAPVASKRNGRHRTVDGADQGYVEFSGYGRIPASLVTDSTEEGSDDDEAAARTNSADEALASRPPVKERLTEAVSAAEAANLSKSCDDLHTTVHPKSSTAVIGGATADGCSAVASAGSEIQPNRVASELRPTRRPPPVPVKATAMVVSAPSSRSPVGSVGPASGKGTPGVAPQVPLRHGRSEERLDGDSGVYSSSMESYLSSRASPQFHRSKKSFEKQESEILETQLPCSQSSSSSLVEDDKEVDGVVRKIIESVIESETAYVDCLDVLHQYGKALSSATRTNQAVLSREDVDTIFFKIEQLLEVHRNFRDGLRESLQKSSGSPAVLSKVEARRPLIGENFKVLAGHLEVYNLFLQNYSKAIESVRRSSLNNAKFDELSKNMKLKGQTTSLEILLHKPVARIQKNALVIDDLLRATPPGHPDYNNLKTASKLTQRFLENLKTNSTLESMFPLQDRAPRHVVRNVFMVQLEGQRKLRHLFLFNDVLVCAKCKTNGRTRYLEVKWFIPLNEVTLLDPEAEAEPIREQHPANVCQLRSRANSIRDQIRKLENKRGAVGCQGGVTTSRNLDKLRRKLSDLEAALMLHSPHLPFKIGHKNQKVFQFFVSSEFERQQWIEAIHALRQQMQFPSASASSGSISGAGSSSPSTPQYSPPTVYELNSCIALVGSKNTLGHQRSSEDMLLGELHVRVISIHGGNPSLVATALAVTAASSAAPAETAIYVCLEVDSYGHFFRKGRTKSVPLIPGATGEAGSEAVFNHDIIMDVDASQTLRMLLYENLPTHGTAVLRGKATFELSKSWLTDHFQDKCISLQEYTLNLSIKYVPYQQCVRRNFDAKPVGTFGLKIEQVCKKEKSTVPFVISCCVREIEKRGMSEVGIYRISGSSSDVQRLRRAFESDPFEAEQLLREVDVNAVAHLLKLYLRELPEPLFTDKLYPDLFDALAATDLDDKTRRLLGLFQQLPIINRNIILHLIDHMVAVNRLEDHNKMSINNLATVFGPTLIRPSGSVCSASSGQDGNKDLLACGTVDVIAQAGILHFFLKRRVSGLPLDEPIESAHM